MFSRLRDADERFGALLLFMLLLIVLLQAGARLVRFSIIWTEEISRYLFIYTIMLGVSAGVTSGGHVGTTVLCDKFPSKVQAVLSIVRNMIFLAFTLLMAFMGIRFVLMQLEFGQVSSATGIPLYLIAFALPIGFVGASIRIIAILVSEIKGIHTYAERSSSCGDRGA